LSLKLYMKESHSFIQPYLSYLFIMPFNPAGVGPTPYLYNAIFSENQARRASQPRWSGSSFNKGTILRALGLLLGGPLTATGFPGIPVSRTINAALCENGTFLLLHQADGSSARTLDIVLIRNSRRLSVEGILLPRDHNLLFRAVATALRLERECGFTQAANDVDVLALRRTIRHQLDEWHGIEQTYGIQHYISQHEASTGANSASNDYHSYHRQPAPITAPRLHVQAGQPAPPPRSVVPTAPAPGVWRPF
jgi:hypothetical protein